MSLGGERCRGAGCACYSRLCRKVPGTLAHELPYLGAGVLACCLGEAQRSKDCGARQWQSWWVPAEGRQSGEVGEALPKATVQAWTFFS
jgi:hypothetical protein